MTRKVFAGLVVCATVGSSLATRTIVGQGQPHATAEEYQQQVLPVLSKSCMSCHNDRVNAGTLSLDAFRDPSAALAQPSVWQNVLDKVMSGVMPPPPAAPLTEAERDVVANWIKKLPRPTESAPIAAAAGRVTARRLNRVEYNNTIRDLLGVAARPADEFPVDDS